MWQASVPGQATVAPEQAPAWHVSPLVQALPSLQAVPSGSGVTEHPVAGLHATEWQASAPGQTTVVPEQAPAWQASLLVQALPSLQAVPSGTWVTEQPVAGLHAVV